MWSKRMREVRTTETRKKAVVWTAIALLLLTLYPNSMKAQRLADGFAQADTLCLRFRLDSVVIDMSYADNAAVWQQFEQNFLRHFDGVPSRRLRLDIFSGASPEGTAAHNRWLGENRGIAIRRLVRQRLPGRVGTFVIHNEAARWDAFYEAVAQSHEPWRDEVLGIIMDAPSIGRRGFDNREWRLRELHGGTVWATPLDRYLPPLRSGATAIVTWEPERVRDTIVFKDTLYVICHDNLSVGSGHGVGTEKVAKNERELADQAPAWAIKTNFLLWGVVAPNIEVEVPLGRRNRWSLELEYFHPWFVWNKNAHASQFLNLGAEIRYWLGRRRYHRWLDGWHIGLAAATGYYDWEWKKHKGYQGEYINTYLNIGYQHRWGRHWGIDAGIGLGMVASKYRQYYGSSTWPEHHLEEWDRHLMYQRSDHFVFWGATHVNVSIVYLFNNWPFRFKAKKTQAKIEEYNEIKENDIEAIDGAAVDAEIEEDEKK